MTPTLNSPAVVDFKIHETSNTFSFFSNSNIYNLKRAENTTTYHYIVHSKAEKLKQKFFADLKTALYKIDYQYSVEATIDYVVNHIINYNFQKVSMQVTSDNSLYFTLVFGNKNAYIELFFEKNKNDIEAFFSVYENKKHMYSYEGTLQDFFDKIDKKI